MEAHRNTLEPRPEGWEPSKPNEKWPGRKKGSYKWYEIQDSVDYHQAFAAPKITYGHFSERPLFSYEGNGLYSNDKSYIIQSNDQFLLALLHSSVFWYLLTGDAPIVRGKFYEMRTYYISALPIPDATAPQKTALATLAETCQTHAESRYALQDGLRHRIHDLRPSGSTAALNTKLKEWWLLPDFAAFRAEVKKCFKADIPLDERTAWEDWITRDKAKIHRLSGEITNREASRNNCATGTPASAALPRNSAFSAMVQRKTNVSVSGSFFGHLRPWLGFEGEACRPSHGPVEEAPAYDMGRLAVSLERTAFFLEL